VTIPSPNAEWLETDASGGFASGTVAGYRTRRYHALLLVPLQPPAERVVLVNGFEAWVESPAGDFSLSTQHYAPDVIQPRGVDRIVGFTHEPWPTWTFSGPAGIEIVQECIVDHVDGTVLLTWRLAHGAVPALLHIRPLLSGRDYHALMRENSGFDFSAQVTAGNVTWRPYSDLPTIAAFSNAVYENQPTWYRNFFYSDDAARGLDHIEDLASPGTFTFDLNRGEALLVLRAGDGIAVDAEAQARGVRVREATRRKPLAALDRAAESYIVRRGHGHTIIAGFPWFTDWGRDTFIAIRGLCIARGAYDIAGSILLEWATTVSEGMLPNRFPDHGDVPEYNAVDASLWYVIAVHELLTATRTEPRVGDALLGACRAILDGYAAGTRYGIRMDSDGLLACGVPGVQLTWMDAKFGDHVVTPRIGKPVEVQALWINALRCAGGRYAVIANRAQTAFLNLFWNASAGCLYDVVDADHERGRRDASIRPNQIFAVGGLPYQIVAADVARAVVKTVECELLTPMGLRSLSPGDSSYRGKYEGSTSERDAAYHQGTVWPWLVGPFVDAWLRVEGDDAAHRAEARQRFLAPLIAHLSLAGLGHVSEIADGDAPHTPRGCPFQAWSLGELIRSLARTGPAVLGSRAGVGATAVSGESAGH
jgi:predicted glycogen debranching enzyme